ncbi:MAG: NAD(P)H-hydrate dehydratase [Leptospiraceae bacterium]|nr:NAD(P)H-hydrate dehydratase [Leptospiraceae bacterium]
MQPVLSRAQIRRYDELAIEAGTPGLELMERAGTGAAAHIRHIISSLANSNPPKILIFCGAGNNGGDGFVVARELRQSFAVKVYIAGEAGQLRGDAKIQYDRLTNTGFECVVMNDVEKIPRDAIAEADVIIDALFGTGLARPTSGFIAETIVALNAAHALRVSLDLPSGLDADTGQPLGATVAAHHTVTFAHFKPGLLTPRGREFAGTLHRVELMNDDSHILKQTGVTARVLDAEFMRASLPRRGATTYKHRAGDILVIAGSRLKTGAAKLAAEAALRSGAGLSTILTWSDAVPALSAWTREVMLLEISVGALAETVAQALLKRSAVVMGPGLGLNQDAEALVHEVVTTAGIPVVLDADALTILARLPAGKKALNDRFILTPHSGELARLLSTDTAAIEADRYAHARRAAKEWGCTVVLKGAHTLIATPDGEVLVSPFINPVLATAGSGDVLSGIIAALSAHLPARDAAAAGVMLHAEAAEIWCNAMRADRGMLARDILETLPQTYVQVSLNAKRT